MWTASVSIDNLDGSARGADSAGGSRALAVGDRATARVVMVLAHGFQMEPADLSPFAHSIRAPALFLFPEAPQTASPRGRAWWFIDPKLRDEAHRARPARLRGAASARSAGGARAHARRVLGAARALAGTRPLVVGGFSQGGMLTCDTMLRSGFRAEAMALFSASRIAFDEQEPLYAARPFAGLPVVVSHGQADPDLSFAAGEGLRDALVAGGAERDLGALPRRARDPARRVAAAARAAPRPQRVRSCYEIARDAARRARPLARRDPVEGLAVVLPQPGDPAARDALAALGRLPRRARGRHHRRHAPGAGGTAHRASRRHAPGARRFVAHRRVRARRRRRAARTRRRGRRQERGRARAADAARRLSDAARRVRRRRSRSRGQGARHADRGHGARSCALRGRRAAGGARDRRRSRRVHVHGGRLRRRVLDADDGGARADGAAAVAARLRRARGAARQGAAAGECHSRRRAGPAAGALLYPARAPRPRTI